MLPEPELAPVTLDGVTAQLNVAPETLELNAIEVAVPLQIVSSNDNIDSVGVGLMLTVKFIGNPMQPFRVGVTEIIPEVVPPEIFAGAFHIGISPVPVKPNPIVFDVFVHV